MKKLKLIKKGQILSAGLPYLSIPKEIETYFSLDKYCWKNFEYDEFKISRCGAEPQRPVFPEVPTNTPPLKALEIFDQRDLELEQYFKRKDQWRDCSFDANIELLKDLQKKK